MCYGCLRPGSHCVCELIPPFRAHCDILILQHPNEFRKYYSTTKLVARAVSNSKVMRGVVFEPGVLERALAGKNPYLLYPSEESHDCEAVVLDEESLIIAIDGTWSEAGKIVRRNPVLASIPRISFSRKLRSNYRIRKQPKEHCLSTIEAIAHLLKLNALASGHHEKGAAYDALFSGFTQMVDQQLASYSVSGPKNQMPHR